METLGDIFGAKKGKKEPSKFVCDSCDFKCCKKFSLDRHLLTFKHLRVTQSEQKVTEKGQKGQISKLCCENCRKEYTSRNGLWKHKKVCTYNTSPITENKKVNEIDKDELIINLLKQNAKLMEILENGTMNHSHNTHTNSHNKAFNLNFFLNETCKNAMNITDFVDSIKLQLTDLMDVGELGYVEGISKIIVKNLNNLDETIRPIHCTDKKRETMYVKDQGEWAKEDEEKRKIKKVIKSIANKNINLLPHFREKFPDYSNSTAKISDTYDKIVIETMTSDECKNEKIIKQISKATTIKEI
jgi:hypothetical protein